MAFGVYIDGWDAHSVWVRNVRGALQHGTNYENWIEICTVMDTAERSIIDEYKLSTPKQAMHAPVSCV